MQSFRVATQSFRNRETEFWGRDAEFWGRDAEFWGRDAARHVATKTGSGHQATEEFYGLTTSDFESWVGAGRELPAHPQVPAHFGSRAM